MCPRRRNFAELCVLALFSAVIQPVLADDWNVGVGGNSQRNSLSGEGGPVLPIRLWEGSVNAVVAQQAVTEGLIAVMPRMEDIGDVLYGTRIVAHNLETGDTLWTTGLPVDFPATDWRSRVSAMRDGRVYATRAGNTNASYFYALDALTGEVLWRSEDLSIESSTEGAAFADDGDLITTGVGTVLRINSEDGTTVWETNRSCPTTGGCDPVVYGDRVYLWEPGGNGPVITAFDLATGQRLFSSQGINGGIVQQNAPFVGPEGTVYAARVQNNPATDYLVALQDTGTGFKEKWRLPIGFVAFASFGVGPDGSVYAYSRTFRVYRIDPVNGNVTDSSEVLVSDFYQPRMAIDAEGKVFVTNGGFSQGALYAFHRDLQSLWDSPETIINVNVGGPALGANGILVVCGVGTDVRAYQHHVTGVHEAHGGKPDQTRLDANYPNPFNPETTITFHLTTPSYVSLKIFDILGREVASLAGGIMVQGTHRQVWDGDGVASGTYYYRLTADEINAGGKRFLETRRMILVK